MLYIHRAAAAPVAVTPPLDRQIEAEIATAVEISKAKDDKRGSQVCLCGCFACVYFVDVFVCVFVFVCLFVLFVLFGGFVGVCVCLLVHSFVAS